MASLTGKVIPLDINNEMKNSYLDYAMSVIVGRALPDVRDGLKPVHRRILYSLHELGLTPDKSYRKSAGIVGKVMQDFHPHGDSAIYDAMVRLAQDFASRYPLIQGHGNFGSIDGDPPAAMRYTEARMAKITLEMLADIDKETVDFAPNYDNRTEEPTILPSKIPNLLVNGSSGIAVGMATNIPPHNMGEVIDGVLMMIKDPNVTPDDLMKVIKGPDFPTGATIMGKDGIRQAYRTGRGSVKMRAQTTIETKANGRPVIIVNEIPYQVNKAKLIEKIAELVKDKKIEGISDLRDESDRRGMRIVIELKKDSNPNVILNLLYKHTQMQESFGIIMLALVNNEPKVLNLAQVIFHYLEHQKDVITRRTRYELKKAEARAHIVEGLRIALANLDEVIKTIRESKNTEEARRGLVDKFNLTEIQAEAIVEMRLRSLTALEVEKLEKEYKELLEKIDYLRSILADEQKVLNIIRDELLVVKEKFADARRTLISNVAAGDFDIEDLIDEEDMVVTITNQGYIKRISMDTYRSQKRGGKGITAMGTKEEDFVRDLFIASTHHFLLFFTNKGKVYRLKVYEVPEASRTAKGTPIINLLSFDSDEYVTTVIPIKEFEETAYLFMATKHGIVKKTALTEYNSSRRDGLIAINLDEKDKLVAVELTHGKEEIIMCTQEGIAIRFSEEDVRPMGRVTRGVKGITLSQNDHVVKMDVIKEGASLLTVTANGYGKRTPMDEYRIQARGGKGIINIKTTKRNGAVTGVLVVSEEDEVMMISAEGIIIRINVKDVSSMGRNTQGVTLMRTGENDHIVAIAKVITEENEEKKILDI
ncbi:DNA gyrase subunit A [Desulforamulus reducens MI-1]|uniref:DNA gyrase subunit A n=1 Tax=Desulforamulus reducens (strain ATCC BAA-1160 / DSM 100696 / MI-1) TaxID=349161 RepID=A4J0F6_DESRM|nr:DNA gyrase subunit A [Desulforamulus reducens]ABO48559.1 DNA gyrase subunit A [Desulforamulus reducens MI-1]